MKEDPTTITRRVLLRWLGGGALTALGVTAGPVGAEGDDPHDAVVAALTRIGRRYLEIAPAERDAVTLHARLTEFTTPADVLAHPAALERAVRRDFERGDILALDGWILSRTELRAAALFALTTPPAP